MEGGINYTYQDLIESKDLKEKLWTGYIWMVECKKPIIFKDKGKPIDFKAYQAVKNPYNNIQEAYLCCDDGTNSEEKISLKITNIDGEMKCFLLHTTQYKKPNFKLQKQSFPSHISGISSLDFQLLFELASDDITLNKIADSEETFSYWKPVGKLFVGLK